MRTKLLGLAVTLALVVGTPPAWVQNQNNQGQNNQGQNNQGQNNQGQLTE